MIVRRFGPPEALHTIERRTPPPGPGQVRLRVLTIGVGFTDLMARGGDYLLQPRPRFTPGYELVGEVLDAGPTRTGEPLAPGRQVAVLLPRMGAYAEHLLVPAWRAIPLPTGLAPDVAAGIPLDYLTATSILDRHAQVTAGDTVLIQGAGGGVGQALSQLGGQRGLRMYGTAGPASRGVLETYGVTGIDYRTEDFADVLRAMEPDGIKAVFDHLGGSAIDRAYQVLGPGGVLVSYAFSGRPGRRMLDTAFGGARVLLGGLRPGRRTAICTLPFEVSLRRAWYRRTLASLLEQVRDGQLRARPHLTYPLEQAVEVHRALERREVTDKVVLRTTGFVD